MEQSNRFGIIAVVAAVGVLLSCCLLSMGLGVSSYMLRTQGGQGGGVPEGWTRYVHTQDCTSANKNLSLQGWSLQHPSDYLKEVCSSFNYITLYEEKKGKMRRQFGLGYMSAPSQQHDELADQLVANLQDSMPPGSRFELRTDERIRVNGESHVRRDHVLHLAGDVSNLAKGKFASRVVLMSGDQGPGLTLILLERIRKGDADKAFKRMDDGDFDQIMRSIRF